MSDTVVIFHAGCADGFCAAWVAHREFGDNAEYIPANYGDSPPDVNGKTVYILDFSYKRPVLIEMAKVAFRLHVLDHHKTAAADLEGLADDPALDHAWTYIDFDMSKSGGRLAWEFWNRDKPAPWLVEYTEDRDLWRWKLPSSREISAALRSHPFDFSVWDDFDARGMIGNVPPESLAIEGLAILRFQNQLIDDAARFASEIDMDGHKVLSVNTTCLVSEIGERLADGRPFSATFFVKSDGKKVWSLRSRGETGIDVSEVAKRRGGGGHKAAAGFTE